VDPLGLRMCAPDPCQPTWTGGSGYIGYYGTPGWDFGDRVYVPGGPSNPGYCSAQFDWCIGLGLGIDIILRDEAGVGGGGTSTSSSGKMGGETLGIPNGMRLPKPSLASIILPGDMQCDFGVCVPIGNGVAVAIPIAYCAAQPHVCAGLLITGYYILVRFGPLIVQTVKDISRTFDRGIDEACELFAWEFKGSQTQCMYHCSKLGTLCRKTSGTCPRVDWSHNLGPCD